jgi:hypothetical protein
MIFEIAVKIDEVVKSPKTPSPSTGEGWGEGGKKAITAC